MEQSGGQPQKTISHADNQRYNQMKNEYSTLVKTVLNLQGEKKENILVLETLEKLDSKRKCWRSIGGVLVERTVGEIIPALKHRNDEELSVKIKAFEEKMSVKQKELLNFEKVLGIAGSAAKEMTTDDKKDGGQSGVLV